MDQYARRLQDFLGVLGEKVASHRAAMKDLDRFLSTGFNVMHLVNPDENTLSDIIAQLLDPDGTHGQGKTFHDLFVRHFGLRGGQVKRVHREYRTRHAAHAGRAMDIVVEYEGSALMIENKAGAADQPAQLLAYRTDLADRFANYHIVYLTPDGHEPSESSLPRAQLEVERQSGRLTLAPYSDVARWVEACSKECMSDKYRWFLRDFGAYLITRFPVQPGVELDDAR